MSKRRRTGNQLVDTVEDVRFEGDVAFSGSLELPTRTTSDTQFIITRSEGETTEDLLTWIGARTVTDAGGKFKLTRINNQVTLVYTPSSAMSTPTASTSTTGWVCQDPLPGPFIPTHTLKWNIIVRDNNIQVNGFFQIAANTGIVTIGPVSGAFSAGLCSIENEVCGIYYVD